MDERPLSPLRGAKPLDGFVVATRVVLCAIWGAQQAAIELAARDVAPILQVGLPSA